MEEEKSGDERTDNDNAEEKIVTKNGNGLHSSRGSKFIDPDEVNKKEV